MGWSQVSNFTVLRLGRWPWGGESWQRSFAIGHGTPWEPCERFWKWGIFKGILQIPDGHRRDNDDNLSIIRYNNVIIYYYNIIIYHIISTIYIYNIIIAVAYLQTNPCFNCKICGNCILGHQRVRSFAGYEAIFVLSIWSHLVSWPNLGCCLRSERVVLPCFAKPRLVCWQTLEHVQWTWNMQKVRDTAQSFNLGVWCRLSRCTWSRTDEGDEESC